MPYTDYIGKKLVHTMPGVTFNEGKPFIIKKTIAQEVYDLMDAATNNNIAHIDKINDSGFAYTMADGVNMGVVHFMVVQII